MKNKITKLSSILLLAVLSLLFIHSEVGIGMSNEEVHKNPDFCDIVSFSLVISKDKHDIDLSCVFACDQSPVLTFDSIIEHPSKIYYGYNITSFKTTSFTLSSLQTFLI